MEFYLVLYISYNTLNSREISMLLGTLADFYRATPSSISGKFHCANSNMNRQENFNRFNYLNIIY